MLTLASLEGLEVAVAAMDAVIEGLMGEEAVVAIERERCELALNLTTFKWLPSVVDTAEGRAPEEADAVAVASLKLVAIDGL